MRITSIIGWLACGGAERVCVNLANAWVERGQQVTLLTISQNSSAPAFSIDPRVDLRNIGWPRWPRQEELNTATIAPIIRGLQKADCAEQLTADISLLALLRHAILSQTPDVVVSHIDLTNLRVLAAMHETDLPVVVCEHTDTTQISLGSWQRVRAALYRRAHAVVATHHAITEWFTQQHTEAVTIPNPLVPPPAIRHERTRNRRRLVALNRLSDVKRPTVFVRAFASIANDFPEWDFDVYGDGPLREEVSNLIDNLAPGRIHLRGFTNAPYDVLKNADLFVSTSWVEGFGNSIWEALACGVPVVAMDAGAPVRSLIRDGVDGVILSDNTIQGLATALASLMRDQQKREALAARAPEVVERFSIEASLQAWDELLNAAVAGQSVSG